MTPEPFTSFDLAHLSDKLGPRLLGTEVFRGDETVVLDREGLLESFRFFKQEVRLDYLSDITAVDYWKKKEPRFEVVYHLASPAERKRLRVKVPVPESDPAVESVTSLWPGANFMEREVWDFFGIRFLGHPNLRRVLLYEEFKGHPLRKDYPVNLWQPLVPELPVEGTFVDERSRVKLLELRKRLGHMK